MTRSLEPIGIPCPLCGRDEAVELKAFLDGVVVGRCRSCGMIYTPKRHPSPEEVLGEAALDELRHAYEPILTGARPHYRRDNYREYLRILAPHALGRRLLDVGCAHGFFAREARGAGFDVTGVEPHPGMAAFAAQENGVRVLAGRIEDVKLDERSFDAATFTDALEYVPAPADALAKVRAALVPGGVLFVKVPNAEYFLLRFALERRGVALGAGEAFSPSERASHFTPATLKALVEKAGFEVVRSGWPRPVHTRVAAMDVAWREVAPRWWEGLGQRLIRSAMDRAGRLEAALAGGANHGSNALFVLARRP